MSTTSSKISSSLSNLIPSIKYSWYYKFNNSAIYKGNTEDPFTQMFWKLGMTNFDDFKEKLLKLPRKSKTIHRNFLRNFRGRTKTGISVFIKTSFFEIYN